MAETEDKVARIRREIEELDEDELAALGGDELEDDMDDDDRRRDSTKPRIDSSNFAGGPGEGGDAGAAGPARGAGRPPRGRAAQADLGRLRQGRTPGRPDPAAEEENAAALMYQALADDDADGATVNFSRGGKPVTGHPEADGPGASSAQPHPARPGPASGGVDAAGVRLLDPDAQFSAGGETPPGVREAGRRQVQRPQPDRPAPAERAGAPSRSTREEDTRYGIMVGRSWARSAGYQLSADGEPVPEGRGRHDRLGDAWPRSPAPTSR